MGEAAQLPAAGDPGTHESSSPNTCSPAERPSVGVRYRSAVCLVLIHPGRLRWHLCIAGSVATGFLIPPTPKSCHRPFTDHCPFFENTHISLSRCVCVTHVSQVYVCATDTYVPCITAHTHMCVEGPCVCLSEVSGGRPPMAVSGVRCCHLAPPSSPGNRDLSISAVTRERLEASESRHLGCGFFSFSRCQNVRSSSKSAQALGPVG